jgi:integrase
MVLNNTQLEQVKKLYADPDWVLVKAMFESYLEPLLDIRNVDDKDTSISVKGEIKAKVLLYNLVKRFFEDVDLMVGRTEEQVKKHSYE